MITALALKKRADFVLEEVFRSLFEEIDTEKLRADSLDELAAALMRRTEPATALAASNNEMVKRFAMDFVLVIRVSFPFVLPSRKRTKTLHSRRGKHDLTTPIQTKKRASRLYLQQQNNGINALNNRFIYATDSLQRAVYLMGTGDITYENDCCSVICLRFRKSGLGMIWQGVACSSCSSSFSGRSLPRYTSSCTSETVRPA
jgi:hypothetical protein